MKKNLAIFSLCALTITVNAQTAQVTTSAVPATTEVPAAALLRDDPLVLTEGVFDFGKIPQGKPVTHVFEVKNNGKDSLRIVNVQASCGCTTPDWERNKALAPGEKTNITVGYNAASEGLFSKQVMITYNGTLTKPFFIKGEVWKTPVTSAPENKDLKNLQD